jgi:hypothetical protein
VLGKTIEEPKEPGACACPSTPKEGPELESEKVPPALTTPETNNAAKGALAGGMMHPASAPQEKFPTMGRSFTLPGNAIEKPEREPGACACPSTPK